MNNSRHIPEKVGRDLMDEARGRCCICRELVLVGSNRHELISEVLEKHHVIYFSKGGKNTVENLLIVDPNCHRIIHKYPEEYPIERLKKAKELWKKIGTHFSSVILYDGDFPNHNQGEHLKLVKYRFALMTYGLNYTIVAPDLLSVSQFSKFLKDKVVNVIASLDGNTELLNSEKYDLALAKSDARIFNRSLLLRDIVDAEDNEFVLHVHVHSVAKAIQNDNFFKLEASPENPDTGQAYLVRFSHNMKRSFDITIDVKGTDGFKRNISNVVEKEFVVRIPGASNGVEDTIVAKGDFGSIRLNLVFGVTQSENGNNELSSLPKP